MASVNWAKIKHEYETSDILLKDLAAKYGVSPGTMRSRKNREGWQRVATRTDNATQCDAETCNAAPSVATQQEPAEPAPFPGQCSAIGHKSGKRCRNKAMPGSEFCRRHADAIENQCTAISKQTGERCKNKAELGKTKCKFHGGKSTGPTPGTQNALKHGFFAKIFPDDEETRAIIGEIMEKGPLDILWENIMIQYLAIARAQRIMFVTAKDEMIKELKKIKSELGPNPGYNSEDPEATEPLAETYREEEWEFQFAWDRHATLLTAQSKAMATLEKLIQRYDALIQSGKGSEEHRLKLEKLKADIAKVKDDKQDKPMKVVIVDDIPDGDEDD